MMVKFLDRIFGRRKSSEGKIILPVSELEDFLRGKQKEREERIYSESRPLIDEILEIIAGLKDIVLEIESKEAFEVNERIGKVLTTSKPQFVRSMLDLVGSVERSPGHGIEGYVRRLDVFLSDMPKVIVGPGRYLHLAYGEELERVRRESRKLLDRKKALDALINANELKKLEEDCSLLKEKLKSVKELESEGKRLATQKESLESEKTRLDERYGSIEKSEEFRSFQEKTAYLEEVRKKREGVENIIYNMFAQVRKPLKSLIKHPNEKSRLSGVSLKELEEYVEKPVETYLAKEPGETEKIFREARKAIEQNESGLKEPDRIAACGKITDLLGERARQARNHALNLRIEEGRGVKELESSRYIADKKDLEKEIERIGREIHSITSDLARVEKRLHEAGVTIEGSKASIEEALTLLAGRTVVLVMEGH